MCIVQVINILATGLVAGTFFMGPLLFTLQPPNSTQCRTCSFGKS